MATIPPWALDSTGTEPVYGATTLRQIFAASLGASSHPLRAVSGVLAGLAGSVSGGTVTISPGMAVIETADGSFVTGIDAAETLTPAPSPAARRDLVVLRIIASATQRRAVLEIIAGSVAPPALPDRAVALAEIAIAPGGALSLTPVLGPTAARGGYVVVPDAASRDRIDLSATRLALQLDTQSLWMFDLGEWWEAAARPAFAYWVKNDAASVPHATWHRVTGWANARTSGVAYAGGLWTVPRSGRYLINASASFVAPASPTGQRAARVRVGSAAVAQSPQVLPTATHPAMTPVTVIRELAAGDEVSLEVYQTQGVPLALETGAPTKTHLEIERLGA